MTGRRVLIVAETPVARGTLEQRVSALGYEALPPSPPIGEGERSAASPPPDLLLVHLPGGEASRAVAAGALRRRGSAPLVFMGSAADEAALADAVIDRRYGYIVLPVADRELGLNLELALARAEESVAVHDLDAFFAVSLDMFCFVDFSGHFKRLNPAWERTLGFTRAELMARPFIEFVHPDDRERTLQQNLRVRSGDQALGFENRYRCKDGTYRWLLWNSTSNPAGGVIYAVARDITDRKRSEEERARLLHELEASLKEVSTLQRILPICSYCRKIRDDADYWHTVEAYLEHHAHTRFSHGICPECMTAIVDPQLEDS